MATSRRVLRGISPSWRFCILGFRAGRFRILGFRVGFVGFQELGLRFQGCGFVSRA